MIKKIFVGKGSTGLFIRLEDLSNDGSIYHNIVHECLSDEKATELSEKLSLKYKVPIFRYDDILEYKPVIIKTNYKCYKNYYIQFIGYDEDVKAWLQWSIYGVSKNNNESELLIYGFNSKEEAINYINEHHRELGKYTELTKVCVTNYKDEVQFIELTIFNNNSNIHVTIDKNTEIVTMYNIYKGSFTSVDKKTEKKIREFIKGLDINRILNEAI